MKPRDGVRRRAEVLLKPPCSVSPAEAPTPTSNDVMPYLSLVRDIVTKYARRLPASVQQCDLVAAGTAGVFDALRRSGADRGPAFEGYVRTRIRGAIVDELRAQDWLTRSARKCATTLTDGHPPSSTNTVVRFEDLSEETRSSFTDEAPSPADLLTTGRDNAKLASAVASLPPRERVVVTLHYLEEVHLSAIARELGVSVARASQLRSRAIAALRANLGSGHLERPASAR
jgi:RNA polymerase sigma factor for flagellar operon FliA